LRSARDDESTVKRAPDGKWLTSGNPAGRPVGSRNKFADNFFADLTAAWTARGKTAMEKTAQDSRRSFGRPNRSVGHAVSTSKLPPLVGHSS